LANDHNIFSKVIDLAIADDYIQQKYLRLETANAWKKE